MTESLHISSEANPNSWDDYDTVLAKNNVETARLQEEHAAKGPIRRRLGRKAFREANSALSIETSQSFINTLTKIDPSLQNEKDKMDALRGPEQSK